jgi:hypothetical protein
MREHLMVHPPPAERLRYSLKADRYSSHQQIAVWLRRYKTQAMPDRACVVYDIGCAQGILGQLSVDCNEPV